MKTNRAAGRRQQREIQRQLLVNLHCWPIGARGAAPMAATNAASEADRAAEVVLARERWLAQALHEVDIADEADAALDAAEKLLRPLAG